MRKKIKNCEKCVRAVNTIAELNMTMKIAEIEIVSNFGYVTNTLNGVIHMVINCRK